MATLKMDSSKVIDNIIKLQKYLSSQGIEWTLVTKMFNGYKSALEKIITHQCMHDLHSVGDSRVSNLRIIKEIKPDIVTMYIKPPALNQAKNIIRYADISLNSSYRTLEALNREAGNAGKIHRVIIMIEMGELREGIIRDNILSFYEKVFNLENIIVIGIGTNLGCMYGVEPTYDKLIQLSLYKQLIEARFQKKLELVSSGSSITLPLIASKKVPKGVNHFRIGETAFLGISPLNNKQFRNLSTNAFEFSAEILELEKKNVMPDGHIGAGAIGQTAELNYDEVQNQQSYRCIADFGEIDVDVNNLSLKDKKIKFIGSTSDMTVYDLGEDKGSYKVGAQIQFRPNYMSVARLMNSRYMSKQII